MLSEEELQSSKALLVVDLEATCSRDDRIPSSKMETIEIGAVVIDPVVFTVEAEFQSFVRPIRKPVLTEFCNDLTGISQDMVSGAATFFEAFTVFDAWIKANADGAAFCSWGAYDRRQLEQDCLMHGMPYSMPPHANLKILFSVRQNAKKRFGMANALALCGIELTGQYHRALDDAKNISKLLPWIIGDNVLDKAIR